MLPVIVIDFDAQASRDAQQIALEACNSALATAECATGAVDETRATRAVAAVSWLSSERVHLELGVRTSDRWVTHEIEFAKEEPEAERWRAIGLSIATLVGEEHAEPTIDAPPEPPDSKPQEPEPWAPTAGLRLGPRVGVGIDRPTVLGGGELLGWWSPSPLWTPLLGLSYSAPVRPKTDLHWRELQLAGGAALRQPLGPVELRWALLFSATQIDVSDAGETLSVWVPGVQLAPEVRWPTQRWWTISARVHTQLNDGATGIARGGEHLGSSPAWQFGGGIGLEFQL